MKLSDHSQNGVLINRIIENVEPWKLQDLLGAAHWRNHGGEHGGPVSLFWLG